MATLEENIAQAISDFDSIERAIEEMGVDVPYDTDTKEYANLIRQIKSVTVDQAYDPYSPNAQSGVAVAQALATNPIKYVESPDAEGNTVYLRDLASGTYVLYGAFRPYEGSGAVCRFSSNLLVNVVKGTLNKVPTSHIQIFYPVHNVVQFCDITDESYNRTDIKLNELLNATSARELIAEALKTSQGSFSNALKANASGEVIRVDDVSPVEHTARVKVSGKNLIPYPYKENAANFNGGTFTVQEDGGILVSGVPTDYTYLYVYSGAALATSGVITISLGGNFENVAVDFAIYDSNTNIIASQTGYGEGMVFNLDDYPNGAKWSMSIKRAYNNVEMNGTVYPQIELGDTATEYEPYIEPTSVTVTRCGKNLAYQNDFTISGSVYSTGSIGGLGYTVLVKDIKIAKDKTYIVSMNKPTEVTTPRVFLYNGRLKALTHTAAYNELVPTGRGVEKSVLGGAIVNTDGYEYIAITTGGASTYTEGEVNFEIKNVQLEIGDKITDYEAYNAETYTPNADGTVEITSLAPTMTLLTDTAGANIELEYNQDSNKAMANVHADIAELDRVQNEIIEDMGDIDLALDAILAIQGELIGGDS